MSRLGRGFEVWDAASLGRLSEELSYSHGVCVGRSMLRWGPSPFVELEIDGSRSRFDCAETPRGAELDPADDERVRFCVHYESGAIDLVMAEPGNQPRLERRLEGHTDAVETCRFGGANRLVSASRDGVVCCWKLETGEATRMLGHEDWVVGAEFLGPSLVLSWSLDGTFRLWESMSGRQKEASPKQKAVTAVCVQRPSASGLFVAGSRQGTIQIWSASHLSAPQAALDAGSPVSALEFVESQAGPLLLVSGDEDGAIRLWDVDRRECVASALALSAVRHLAVSGSLIVAADQVGNLYHFSVNQESAVRKPIRLFVCYDRKDEAFLDTLQVYLRLAQRQGLVVPWSDRMIRAGDDWKGEIDAELERADLILLLVSADFIASDYCWGVEMARAMERHEAGEARVLPVIVRDVSWREAPFGRLQSLPTDGKPVAAWPDRDSAWRDVMDGIERVISQIRLAG